MTRRAWTLLAGLLMAAAAPSPPAPLPEPPIPPAHPPLYQTAPVPDRDAQAPTTHEEGAQFNLTMFRVNRPDQSLGYANGSHFQTSEEKRPIQTPGFTVVVPLQ